MSSAFSGAVAFEGPVTRVPAVLVVDDDRIMVRTLCDVLRRSGFAAEGVYSGEEALEAAAVRTWSVILMDIRMTGITGVEAMQALQRSRIHVPVVLMTAYTAAEVLTHAIAAGVDRVLAKPIAPALLLHALRAALAGTSHVVLVDDNEEFLKTLSAILAGRGIQAHRAADRAAAVTLLRERPTGLILLDLKLGQDDPCETVIAIRQAAPTADLIAYSGHPDAVAAARTLPGEWFRALLAKPIDPERLLELLDDHQRR